MLQWAQIEPWKILGDPPLPIRINLNLGMLPVSEKLNISGRKLS